MNPFSLTQKDMFITTINGNIIIPTSTKLQLGDTSINSDTNGNILMNTSTNGSVLLNTKLAFSDTDYLKKETIKFTARG